MAEERVPEVDVAAGKICARCGAMMKIVVTIEHVGSEPGLIAYECPKCWYVTSDLHYPGGADGTP
jgi:hypothetical protein